MANIGYARTSTKYQKQDRQIDMLTDYGCDIILTETISGNVKPNVLYKAIDMLGEGDSLVVTELDRLGRSVNRIAEYSNLVMSVGANIVSINDGIVSNSPGGRLYFNTLFAFSEFERSLISKRTKSGLKSARSRGRLGGRPRGLTDTAKIKAEHVANLYLDGNMSVSSIAKKVGICKATLYRYLRHMDVAVGDIKDSQRY